jgi:hypothetical protein
LISSESSPTADSGLDMCPDRVGVVPNSLQDIGRASDEAKRRPVEAKGWAGTLARVSWRLDSLVSRHRRVTQNS